MSGARIEVDLPPGWEGVIDAGGTLPDGSVRHSLVHLANFPLPVPRGDYGAGAVEIMGPGDVFVVVLEFDPTSASSPLFSIQGIPRPLRPSDFNREMLQRPIDGQSGVQRFFTVAGRAFCLYAVVGSHIDRADLLEGLNLVLDGLAIAP